jgi:hypothetical protein
VGKGLCGEVVKPTGRSKLSIKRMRNTNLLTRVCGENCDPTPTRLIGVSVNDPTNSSLERFVIQWRGLPRVTGTAPHSRRSGTDDLQHARTKTATGIRPDTLESIHINRGRCVQMARECDLDAVRIGRVSVVVRDGESPLQGEGKQSMWLASPVTDLGGGEDL